jgi:anti-anti-sigma factor
MKIECKKLSIFKVEELHKKLLEKISNSSAINIDLSEVEKIELSAIQLFLSLQKSCKEKGIKLTFSNINENVLQNIEISGCSTFLGV